MLKFATIIATLCLLSVTNADLVTTHQVAHEPTLTNLGQVVHSAPSAVSHQSFTQVHGITHVVESVLTPVVKTTVHGAPIVVKTVEPVIPIVKAIHASEVRTYHSAPIVQSVPILHSAPLL